MNPLFVVAAVRAAIRIGRTAADAFEQYAQEKPILIPDAERLDIDDPAADVRGIAAEFPEFAELLKTDPELSKLWQNDRPTAVADAVTTVYAVALRYRDRNLGGSGQVGAQTVDEIAGGVMVAQWARGKGPVTPAIRIVVALADVALEYIGSNPQVLGVGGSGEKLIAAIAVSLSEAIPDAETRDVLGPRDRFAERLAALALQSGLKTLSENPELVIGEEHLQALLKNVLPPLVQALPEGEGTLKEQVEWRRLVDALLGPSLSAALATVAENQTAFLGKRFEPEKAAGAMVSGLLKAAKELDADKRFTEEGLLALFQAIFAVAAEHPALILGELLDKDLSKKEDRDKVDELALNIFKSIADVLKEHEPRFGDELGIAIVTAVIQGLKKSKASLLDQSDPWQKVAGDMAAQILDGFAEALGDDAKRLKDTVFSEEQLVELARVFVNQIAETPHMVRFGNKEIRRVVGSVARAMAKDENLLLTADDWTKIAQVAAQEAALNPGRLFGLSEKTLQGQLAEDIISRLLKAAAEDLARQDREAGPLLIGETLREAIVVTLRGIGGNVEEAFNRRTEIETLAKKLNEAAATRSLTMGGKEWLRLFRALLPDVLSKGVIPELDDATIAELLAE